MSCEDCRCGGSCSEQFIHTQDHIQELEEQLGQVTRERDEYLKERNELIVGMYDLSKERDNMALAWMNESTDGHQSRQEVRALKKVVQELNKTTDLGLTSIPPFHSQYETCTCPSGCVHWQ